jgi:cyclophilin family peptidyl-prolyl cis-trans isomerase
MCVNFTGLAEGSIAPRNGQPFYTGLTWYRVVPGFVMQSGNPGLKDTDDEKTPIPHHFPDEFVPGLHHDAAGVLSMANAGPDTNSCEFFLTLAPAQRLNYLHSVFGRVVRGVEVLPEIRQGDALTLRILRVGAQARAFRADAATFASLAAAAPDSRPSASPARARTSTTPTACCPSIRPGPGISTTSSPTSSARRGCASPPASSRNRPRLGRTMRRANSCRRSPPSSASRAAGPLPPTSPTRRTGGSG